MLQLVLIRLLFFLENRNRIRVNSTRINHPVLTSLGNMSIMLTFVEKCYGQILCESDPDLFFNDGRIRIRVNSTMVRHPSQ